MKLPGKCVVDTNVPITANRAIDPDEDPDAPDDACVDACVEAIEYVIRNKCLIIDEGDEIYDEYLHKLCLSGEPGIGDRFAKWVHSNRWGWNPSQRVEITKDGNSYREFPDHSGLNNFDLSDRKFVAVSNAYSGTAPILQATDSKWWGWKEALGECGIPVFFLCPGFIQAKYAEKIGDKTGR